jgi:hypothetical protein
MRPGHDRPAARRRIARRHDHDARHQDRLVVQPGRTIEHAVGGGAQRRAIDHLLPNQRARSARRLGCRRAIERGLRVRRIAPASMHKVARISLNVTGMAYIP